MADRFTAKVGESLTLEAQFKIDDVLTDVFEILKVELVNSDLVTLETVGGVDVLNPSTGTYSATFGPVTESGTLCDVWTYLPVEDAAPQELTLMVEVAGVDGSEGETPPTTPTEFPDIGEAKICEVRHTFFDAGGNFLRGVFVRFRPRIAIDAVIGPGTIARDIDVESGEDGKISMFLVRGVLGTLAISGIGLVREVVVPEVGVIDLMDLMATGDDLLEVQRPEFIDLPRRS